jgi:hypothetical protein
LRASLRIGRDAARIIIGRPGDQARTQRLPDPPSPAAARES